MISVGDLELHAHHRLIYALCKSFGAKECLEIGCGGGSLKVLLKKLGVGFVDVERYDSSVFVGCTVFRVCKKGEVRSLL